MNHEPQQVFVFVGDTITPLMVGARDRLRDGGRRAILAPVSVAYFSQKTPSLCGYDLKVYSNANHDSKPHATIHLAFNFADDELLLKCEATGFAKKYQISTTTAQEVTTAVNDIVDDVNAVIDGLLS